MRAVVADEYGGPAVLEVRDVDEPKVGPDYVLVHVHAAGINPVDYKIVAGSLDARFPVLWPLTPGWDVAGEVVGVGPAVRHVEVGQQVSGYARKDFVGAGTWAEQVAVPARGLAPAPADVDAVADFVGGGALDASDELLRIPGRVVSIRDPQAAKQRRGTYVFVRPDVAHLAALAELVDTGRLAVHVQSVYDLEAVRDAVTEASSGRVRGKVVLRVP